MKKSIFLVLLIILVITKVNAQIAGSWKGALDLQGNKLEIIFHINENNNQFTSTMDIPVQGAIGLEIDKTVFKDNELELNFLKAGIYFETLLSS